MTIIQVTDTYEDAKQEMCRANNRFAQALLGNDAKECTDCGIALIAAVNTFLDEEQWKTGNQAETNDPPKEQ